MNIQPEEVLSVAEAARRVAAELQDMGDRMEGLERNLEKLINDHGVGIGSTAIGQLQEIDLIIQSSEALSTFMKKMSEAAAADDVFPLQAALDAMPLKAMALRLRGGVHQSANSGVPELF